MHIFDKKIKRVLSNWLHACVPSIVILCRHNVYDSVFSLHPSGFFPFLQFSVPRILRPIFIQCPRSLWLEWRLISFSPIFLMKYAWNHVLEKILSPTLIMVATGNRHPPPHPHPSHWPRLPPLWSWGYDLIFLPLILRTWLLWVDTTLFMLLCKA